MKNKKLKNKNLKKFKIKKNKNMLHLIILVFFGIIPLILSNSVQLNIDTDILKDIIPNVPLSSADPKISVDGNADLNGQFSGTGDGLSWVTAYKIEDMNIDAENVGFGINISNTNKYLIIENCTVKGGGAAFYSGIGAYDSGIFLNNCSNVKILECNVSNNGRIGISLLDCEYVNITDNNATSNSYHGISLLSSHNNTVMENNVSENEFYGITFSDSINNTFLGNNVSDSIYGFNIAFSDNNTLSGNDVFDNSYGFYISDSTNNTLSGNNVSENNRGIYLLDSDNNTLSGNIAIDVPRSIWLHHSDNNTLSGNDFYKGGIFTNNSYDNSIDTSNTVNGEKVRYYEDRIDLNLDGNTESDVGQVILVNCSGSKITNLEIYNSSYSILLNNCSSNNLTQNNISGSYNGIYLEDTYNNTLSENNLTNCNYGIYLWESNNNTILENNVSETMYGIYLRISINNTISGNTVTYNQRGIYIVDADNNTISGNNASSNWYGIRLWNLRNNTLSGNYASNNSYGIYLNDVYNTTIIGNNASDNYDGIYLSGSENNTVSDNNASYNGDNGISIYNSKNNTFLGNNVTDNTENGIWISFSNDNEFIDNELYNNGFYLTLSLDNEINTSNTVNGKKVRYYEDQTAINLDGNIELDVGQVIMVNCTKSLISNINISYASNAILLLGSKNNTLLGNNVLDNNYGIRIEFSDNNTIIENNASYNQYGFYLRFSNNNTISGNYAYNNTDCGIYLGDSEDNNVTGNNLFKNFNSITIFSSHNNSISANNVSVNEYGINLVYSEYNTIFGNNASYNIYYGIQISSSDFNNISTNNASSNIWNGINLRFAHNNTISGNNISNNHIDGIDLISSLSNNITDNDICRNYERGIDLSSSCYYNEISHNRLYYNVIEAIRNGGGLNNYIFDNDYGDEPPNIDTRPDDLIINEGDLSQSFVWNATDTDPDQYNITRNETIIVANGTWNSGDDIVYNIPALSPGSYSFQINYNDSLGQVSSDTVILTVEDVDSPNIDTRPDDLIINEGDLSQSFVWNATDTDPDKYNITRDGTIIVASGTWSSGDDIVYNIPALSPGSYSFQINYNDSLGQVSSDTAILTVEDNTIPVITVEAVNKTLVEGFIDEEVNWTVTDLHPNTYFISINGTINVSAQVWSSGTMIVFDIPESLKAGLYLITLNISDESGNSIENTIFITVEVKSTGNNNGNNGDLDYLMTFIIIAAISIVFLVLFRSFGWRSISKKKIGSKLNSFLEQPGIGQSTLEHTTDNVLLSIKEQNSVIERANLIIPTMDLDIEDIPEEELFD